MQRAKHAWKRLPDKPRRTLTFILGMLFIVSAGMIGPLPGPGGTVLFLLGIAVLATEFEWAERLRDRILELLKRAGRYIRQHPRLSTLFFTVGFAVASLFAYVFYTKII